VTAPRRRVLIVDDQPANIHVLAEALRRHYELYFATSGAAALERAASGDLDLVLLDVMMPEMDGFEVCRRIKSDEATHGLPVIFVTALGEVDDETRGFDAGGVDYIAKPISPPIVRARVRTHIELKEARDRLQELASLDGLTGIPNRRRLDVVLDQEWRRAVRGKHWISVALLDVDYFKKFNDHYGHARGDECLRSVAHAVSAACRRPADLVARYGGEEFAVVLPETDPEGACDIVRALLAHVQALAIEHAASGCAPVVTVSVGAASLVPDDPAAAGRAIEEADRLLYEAKEKGRRQGVHRDLGTGAVRVIAGGPVDDGGKT
jgi:diguanylate cyclase (GGDEF)-like protein